MTKKENYPKHSSNVNNEIASKERDYIKENLSFFIEKEADYKRIVFDGKWHIHADDLTCLRYLLVDYILKHFTLRELYTTFYYCQCLGGYRTDFLKDSKKVAISCIRDDYTLTAEQSKRLKRKVSDMNPIMYGLIHNLILTSNLFFRDGEKGSVYPDFSTCLETAL
jgi:hypothetical protein